MVFQTGYNQWDVEKSGPWLPNFYSQAYDVAFFTAAVYIKRPQNLFIRRAMAWILGLDSNVSDKDLVSRFGEIFMERAGWRPNIKNKVLSGALSHVSPLAILTNRDLMGGYIDIPSGKVLKVSSDKRI